MTTRLVRQTNRFRITAIIVLCLLTLAGATSFALNRSGHGQKDPTAITYEDYEEDEDPLAEAVASLMDTAKSLHGTMTRSPTSRATRERHTRSRRTCTFPRPTPQTIPRTSST